MTGPGAVLSLANLNVHVAGEDAILEAVDLALAPAEILGLVGESGCGKTTTLLSILGYTTAGVQIVSADVHVGGRRLASVRELQQLRGSFVSFVPQNPGTSLNPSLRVGDAVTEMLRAHRRADTLDPRALVGDLFATVGLPRDQEFMRRYPHQLSGGQQQRVCIAVALAARPQVIVLDEPTTGLDVVTQARILDELRRLRDQERVSMVYVTHDLAVVAQIADRIAVMYAGRIVEEGAAAEVLARPRHPYTRGLLASTPDHVHPGALQPMVGIAPSLGERPPGCAFAPRCPARVERCAVEMPSLERLASGAQVRCFEWRRTPPLTAVASGRPAPVAAASEPILAVERLRAEYRSRGEVTTAVAELSFTVGAGACVALVGESGSGKTTVARVIAGLHPRSGGRLLLAGEPLPDLARRRTREQRRKLALVFQNPTDSLNPRHTVSQAVARPARVLRGMNGAQARAEVDVLLEQVRLPARLADRYPRELSGGERQRVALARALAAAPDVIVCDEVTSSLDVSVQAAVLALLRELREQTGVSLLFITHDLGVVATIADDVLVLEAGVVRERGTPEQILGNPTDAYTQRLLSAAPSLSTAITGRKADARRGTRSRSSAAADKHSERSSNAY
jgi:peptide/nickel transport system ATP-binding protein